jgi:undecaprenyl-diphosphatase
MSTLEALVLGAVQGLTEFLPISSSGHLRIVPALLGWPDPGAGFTAVIQLGTMAAVLIYFRSDLWRIGRAWLGELRVPPRESSHEAKLGWFSFVMLLAEHLATRRRPLADINGRDGLYIGLAQSLALIPGVSRSGATISAGLLRGFDRVAAARYSFLLSVPAVVLSGLFELRKVGESGSPSVEATVIATLVAFATGYLSIAWLLRYLATHSLRVFVEYRIALGILVLALTATGAIS